MNTANLISLADAHIGIDIGRVLMCPSSDDGRPDTSFLDSADDTALQIPPAPHALEVIAELVSRCAGRVWLVSKAGQRIETLTRRWFDAQRFFARSGMTPDHVRFCRKRQDKRTHALELGLTHFIDDRVDVLMHLRGVVPSLYLFGTQSEPPPTWTKHVRDWYDVERELLPSAAPREVKAIEHVDHFDHLSITYRSASHLLPRVGAEVADAESCE